MKIVVGILCLALAAGYLFFPKLISRINTIVRDHCFNDKYIITRRRQIGGIFLVLGIIALFMGFSKFLTK